MKEEEKRVGGLIPLNLQFFASDDGENDDEINDDVNEQGTDDNSGEKTFTQSQVSAMMAKEKKEGRKAILNSLGFKSEAEAKKAVETLNTLLNPQKEGQDDNKVNKQVEDEKNEALKRAEDAENKLTCLTAGVSKDSIDDVLAIAKTKITEEKKLDAVLEEMKKEPKYASFFPDGEDNDGTGNDPGYNKEKKKPSSLGKRLAEQTVNKSNQKSSFFSN